mgnify:CR=1 FL=1
MENVNELLSQEALKDLHQAYTKNYVAHTIIKKSHELLIQKTKEWFKENGYEDPDVKLATNEDFLKRADNDEKAAEMIKTQYTTRWAEINELKWALMKSDVEIESSIEWMKFVLNLIK